MKLRQLSSHLVYTVTPVTSASSKCCRWQLKNLCCFCSRDGAQSNSVRSGPVWSSKAGVQQFKS